MSKRGLEYYFSKAPKKPKVCITVAYSIGLQDYNFRLILYN